MTQDGNIPHSDSEAGLLSSVNEAASTVSSFWSNSPRSAAETDNQRQGTLVSNENSDPVIIIIIIIVSFNTTSCESRRFTIVYQTGNFLKILA